MSEHHGTDSSNNLRLAFFLNFGFSILEFIGGFITNSVAIMSDALHDLGDSISLGLAWYLNKKSGQKADENYTYGYERFSLLGALVNSLILVAGSVFIVVEAVGRLSHPELPDAHGMIIFALVGIAVNGFAAWKLHSGESRNEKVVSWHLLEDVLGWVAVLIVAIVLTFKDIPLLDPLLSIAIAIFILFNVVRSLKETLSLFLQGKPAGVDLDEIRTKLLSVDGINSIHHTHLWSLDGRKHVFTTHIVLDSIHSFDDILRIKKQVAGLLKEYPISHHTIETELNNETCSLIQKNGR